ncbi:MAG: DUF2726 domain-containing protein [Wenzhouxiangella sp.]|nr:MAG: DUF2726 domain-containing protein [Wenzhouxiangella sp.]
MLRHFTPQQPVAYRLTELLSPAERSFFGVLTQAAGEDWRVFAKVRIADVLTPQKGLSRSRWQSAFNAISAKHFDFVLCDPADCAVKLAVELDDKSHAKANRRKRDRLVEAACESGGLPLLRVRAARAYQIAEIRNQIQDLIMPKPDPDHLPGSVSARGDRREPTFGPM